MIAVVGLLTLQVIQLLAPRVFLETAPLVAILVMLLPMVLQLLMMFGACLWGQFALGMKDYRVAATTCYYASPLMWPTVLVIAAGFVIGMSPLAETWAETEVPILGFEVTLMMAHALAVLVLVVGTTLFWFMRLMRALRDVRYANV